MRKLLVGVIKLWEPLTDFSEREREQIADTISAVAADILKGQAGAHSGQWEIRILKETKGVSLA